MFHFHPSQPTQTFGHSSPPYSYTSYPSRQPFYPTSAYSYEDYDLQRSVAEHEALARKQFERRQAEETLISRRRQELAVEQVLKEREQAARRVRAEQERKQALAYEAAVREMAVAREHQRIAELVARKREYIRQQEQEAKLERHRHHVEAHRLRQHQQAVAAQRIRQAQIAAYEAARVAEQPKSSELQDEMEVNPIEFFLKLVFGQDDSDATPTTATPSHFNHAQPSAESENAAPTVSFVTPEAEAAATVLQNRFRAHQHRRENLNTLASLTSAFDSHQANLVLPSHLVFRPSPPSSVSGDAHASTSAEPIDAPATPQLAYLPGNSVFLAHEEFLVGMLQKIDTIESGGDKVVKAARKDLVKRIEEELTKLDVLKVEEFEKSEANATAPKEGLNAEKVVDSLGVQEKNQGSAEVAVDSNATLDSDNDDDNATLPPLIETAANKTAATPPVPADSAPPLSPDATPVPVATATAYEDSSLSTTSSLHTLLQDQELDEAVTVILKQAEKLGQEVVALEHAELAHVATDVKLGQSEAEVDSEGEQEREGYVVL